MPQPQQDTPNSFERQTFSLPFSPCEINQSLDEDGKSLLATSPFTAIIGSSGVVCVPVCDGRSRPEGKSLRHGARHSREHTASPALLLGRRLSRSGASRRRTAKPCGVAVGQQTARGRVVGKAAGMETSEQHQQTKGRKASERAPRILASKARAHHLALALAC